MHLQLRRFFLSSVKTILKRTTENRYLRNCVLKRDFVIGGSDELGRFPSLWSSYARGFVPTAAFRHLAIFIGGLKDLINLTDENNGNVLNEIKRNNPTTSKCVKITELHEEKLKKNSFKLCAVLETVLEIFERIILVFSKISKDNINFRKHVLFGPPLSTPNSLDSETTETLLFDMFKTDENPELMSVGKFLAALSHTGLRKNDPRLAGLMENLRETHKESGREGVSPETQKLDRITFKRAISANLVLISKAFRHHFIIPDFKDFTKHIEEFYWKCKPNTEGKVANYIPQLARVNPDYWGISVCTIDGQRFSIGDVKVPFTLQSTSKPLNYGIALDQLGQSVVHQYVGQEPSGRNFNELVLDHNKKPHNPMINAGAILVCSLLKTLIHPEMTLAEKFDFTMNFFKRLAGGEYLGFNNAVFLSEREAADRNYALGFYMREHKCYPEKTNLKECMDFYFQCCSMEANCESMSVMAATLANGGICPITEEKVLKPDSIRDVLSLMHSCGMYDYSGQFAFKVGLPAKSGVSGGMLIVIPNVMGICSWSPPLDPLGNSCRGVQFCEELVNVFNFHRYDNLKHATNKKDPRKHKYETKGLNVVNLLFAAASGDLSALRRHRLSAMDMSLSDYDGRTAMHLAAAEGHFDCVRFLRECNVPMDVKDRWGNSPMDEAKTFGRNDILEFLNQELENLKKNSNKPMDETSPLPKA